MTTPNAYRYVVLALLVVISSLCYLDRQIIGILVTPIKDELGLNDAQMGAIGGIAFVFLYALLSVPFAMIADKTNRTWTITVALAVWSGFTALCGVAGGFWQLLLFRLGMGVGQAGGIAPSYSVIAAYFPLRQRARALAVFNLGIPFGMAGGFLVGGLVAEEFGWRAAFLIAGGAGLVFAPLFRLLVREPQRVIAPSTPETPVLRVFGILARCKAFWLMSVGGSIGAVTGYALLFWLPSALDRSHGLNLTEAGRFTGFLVLISNAAGILIGGVLSDHLGRASRGAYALVPGIAYIVSAPLYVAATLSDSLVAMFVIMLVPQALVSTWLSPIVTATQALVPENMRSTAPACLLVMVNLIGLGLGPSLVGAVSDALTPRFADEALRYALVAAFPLYAVGGVLLLLASRALPSEWRD